MIREATERDYPAFATLFRELGVDDPTPARARWTTELAHETLVFDRDGQIDGYVSFYTLRDAGYVRNLVVAPSARGRGIGRALMLAAGSELRVRGAGIWHLNVKCGNAAAIKLYAELGMRVEHRSSVLRLPWQQLDRLPSEPAEALPVDPVEDDDLERTLGLLAGRIAMVRMRADRVLVQLRDAQCAPVGFASFDPSLGANPLRVARPALIGTLLRALAPHARGEHVQLVVDDHAALADVLIATGAEVRLELLHYAGALPRSSDGNGVG